MNSKTGRSMQRRRSMQRQGWLGYLALATLVFPGILSGQLNLAFVALVAGLLCALFVVGFLLLRMSLQAKARERRVLAAGRLP